MTIHNITVSKADNTWAVDFDSLPAVSQNFIIAYGLRQYLNDGVAGIKTGETDSRMAVNGRVEQLTNGTVGVRATAEKNPVKALAKQELTAKLKAKGHKAEDVSNFDDLLESYMAKHSARLKQIIALKAQAKSDDDDILADILD